jgi:hypothetical protein
LFRTACKTRDKVCKVIIDSGSIDKLVSKEMVENLKLETKEHLSPYRMSWLEKGHQVMVCCSVHFHYSGVPNPLGLTIHYMDVKTNAFNQNSTLLKLRVKYMGTAIINHSIAFIINSFTQRKT